jgi:hypothetical protein
MKPNRARSDPVAEAEDMAEEEAVAAMAAAVEEAAEATAVEVEEAVGVMEEIVTDPA